MDKEKLYAVTAMAILAISVIAFAVVGMTEMPKVNEVTIPNDLTPQHGTSINNITVTVKDQDGYIKSITHLSDE